MNIEVWEPKLILAEGLDAKLFCIQAMQAYGLHGIQVEDFGGTGNRDLGRFLDALVDATGFSRVRRLAVATDSEHTARGRFASVCEDLARAGMPEPSEPFSLSAGEGILQTMVILFPGLDETGELVQAGTLEHACLAAASDTNGLDCAEQFLVCARATGCDVRRPHKAKLHAYLAAHNRFVGMKIGEASKAGAWDWGHPRLVFLRDALQAL